jgi:hypothetical protein
VNNEDLWKSHSGFRSDVRRKRFSKDVDESRVSFGKIKACP